MALLALGCSNAGESFGFGGNTSGQVGVFVFLDRDGSLGATGSDTVLAGVSVGLVVAGTTDTAFRANTDATGNAVFNGIPLGDYKVVVDTASAGDSTEVQSIDSAIVTLRNNDPQQIVTVRVGFPLVTVTQARAMAAGARVFIKGILLAPPGTYGDTTAYVSDGTLAIRLTNAVDAPGPPSGAGDSVRVLGTLATRLGQPVMDTAVVILFQFGTPGQPAGTSLTTLQASTAQGGARDADLVVLSGAVIASDTSTNTAGDYSFSADDGSGAVTVILDADVGFPLLPFTPGKTLAGKGILVPDGTGAWVFKPRITTDVTVQ
jgi:hypothetical protein